MKARFAGMAGAAMALAVTAHPVPAFGLSVSPAKFIARPGQVAAVRITDSGSKRAALSVSLQAIEKNGDQCRLTPVSPSWAHLLTPASVKLRHGQSAIARVRIGRDVPAGSHSVGVTFTTLAGVRGTVAVRAALASQMVVTGHGAKAAPCIPAAAPQGGSGAFPWPLAGYAAGGLALAALLIWWGAYTARLRRRLARR